MELEFDKEIDALMRKGQFAGRGVLVGDTPKAHLDADELAAFAENAMPEKTRALHMAHLADCDRCRKILSSLIMLNAEAEPEKAAAVVPEIAASVPWYRRLLLFPNLAYVMGGLVLVFGGLLAISVLQTSNREAATSVSQVTDAETGHGPMAASEPDYLAQESTNSPANASANVSANSNAMSAAPYNSANTAANATGTASNSLARSEREITVGDRPIDVLRDADDAKQPVTSAAPPPAMAEAPKGADLAMKPGAKEEDKIKAKDAAENEKNDAMLKAHKLETQPRTQAGGPAKSVPGPSRDMQQNFPNRADNTYELRSRRVGGKDFQFRNGAWYDNAFRGQATTNVRRGSDDYRKLDSGVRVIAESLSGVVVLVWKDKAYRIQ